MTTAIAPKAQGVRMPKTEKPKCASCGSAQVYYRMRDNAVQCRICGATTPKEKSTGKKGK